MAERAWEFGSREIERENNNDAAQAELEAYRAEVRAELDDEDYEAIAVDALVAETMDGEDSHLESAYEDQMNGGFDLDDFHSRWDDDPSPYDGTYSEE